MAPGLPSEAWLGLLGEDPRPWLLDSDEPWARWLTLTRLLDRPAEDPSVSEAHGALLADPLVRGLLGRLPEDWEEPTALSGHDQPSFAPSLLVLLSEMGVGPGDEPRIEHLLDAMLGHTMGGRFAAHSVSSRMDGEARWGALLCDSHAIAEALLRFGRGSDPRLRAVLRVMSEDIAETEQGRGWPCVPDEATGFRGPGRKADFCPQVTLQGLRVFAMAPPAERPSNLLGVARTSLRAWRERATEKPYMFGHGKQFKTVKWPATWYRVDAVLDTLGRYPDLWRVPEADPKDRRALAELTACLAAYDFSSDGTVTPRSVFRGFEAYSFGQKKRPSPFATARLCAILRGLDDLADEACGIDVTSLTSSKGGSGTALPPR